jgi:Ca-activated chloride channel family protein
MSFIWPIMLVFLLLVPLYVVMYMRLQRQRRQMAERYGSMGLGTMGAGLSGKRRHIPAAFFLVGLTLLLFSLARPQTVVSLPRVEGTVMLAFDVSGSMSATDMQPTRMEAAKVAAREFVQRQPSTVQIGVVAFSDSGLAVQPPTNDQALIMASIDRLTPQRGTSLGQGILAALATLEADKEQTVRRYSTLNVTPTPVAAGSNNSSAIVLLSDGENNANPAPQAAAQAAADRGVRIYTIGIGSVAGTTLEVNGFSVHTQLDEALLKDVAQISQGMYYNAQNGDELRSIYQNLNLQFVIKQEDMEVTSLLAAASIVIILVGAVFSMIWFGRVP